jgi:hypothetical protein
MALRKKLRRLVTIRTGRTALRAGAFLVFKRSGKKNLYRDIQSLSVIECEYFIVLHLCSFERYKMQEKHNSSIRTNEHAYLPLYLLTFADQGKAFFIPSLPISSNEEGERVCEIRTKSGRFERACLTTPGCRDYSLARWFIWNDLDARNVVDEEIQPLRA